ncbi:hypothetical protein BU17DRAFT_62876 [Hysterangium stoloniferum]|nr:hypothetical protein BU17DRAFT_62876 [Hysterangium stoloniferum]
MAAPAEMTTAALSGTFVMNKNLSDDTDKILELQGVSWFVRKAIGFATITLHVKQYKDEGGVEHIDIKQTLTGGIGGTEENRTLDWTERSYSDRIFGDVVSKSRRISLDEVTDEFLKTGWIPEAVEPGVIHSYVVSDTSKSGLSWTAEQIWGFELIGEEKRYVRHVHFTSGDTIIKAKLIYDYITKAPRVGAPLCKRAMLEYLDLVSHNLRPHATLLVIPVLSESGILCDISVLSLVLDTTLMASLSNPAKEKVSSPETPKPPRKSLSHFLPSWVGNNLNKSSYKILFRTWVAAWASFLLMIPNRSLETFGNAYVQVYLLRSAYASSQQTRAFFACMTVILIPPSHPVQLFFFVTGIMVLGSLLGWAWGCLAMKISLLARSQVLLLSQIQLAQQTTAGSANLDALFELELFQGHFLDPRSSVVFGIFFAVGVFFFAVARASSPRLSLFSVFGTIFLDIICSYGPLFPVPNYTILQSFVSCTAASVAISCVVVVFIFPETLNHSFLNGIAGLISVLRQLIELQERVLTISHPEQPDLASQTASQMQTMRSGALSSLQKLSGNAGILSVEFSYGRFNGEDIRSILEPLTILISRIGAFPVHSSTLSDPVQGTDDYLLRGLDGRSETIGLKREADILQLMVLPVLHTATADLRRSCVEALQIASQLIIRVNTTRWKDSTEPELDLDAFMDKLRLSLDEFKNTGRLEIVQIFKRSANPPNPETDFPRWAVFYAFVFQANLIWVAEGILNLLETLAEIARKRPRSRLWAPKSLRAIWKLITANDDGDDSPFHEDDPPIDPVEVQRAQMSERCFIQCLSEKDPDSKPPTNAFQHVAAFIFRCFAWCKTPKALYAFKYTIVSVALWLPGVFKTSAFFNYANKGIWALIIYFGRLTATTAGIAIGLIGWYIGAGNGNGNPFGIAAVMGVILIPLMFWRVFTPSIVPAIMGGSRSPFSWLSGIRGLTRKDVPFVAIKTQFLTVVSQDTYNSSETQVLGGQWPGKGSGASAIMMFIPPKSARTAVRHSNAALVFKLSQLYGLLISEWIFVEEGTELGQKRTKQTPGQLRSWSDKFRKDFTKVGVEIQGLKVRTSLARWEGSIRGAWPVKEYEELNNVESDMLFYIAQLAGAVYHLDPVWRTRLVHRTKFLNPNFGNLYRKQCPKIFLAMFSITIGVVILERQKILLFRRRQMIIGNNWSPQNTCLLLRA